MSAAVVPIEIVEIVPTDKGFAVFLASTGKVFVIYVEPALGLALADALQEVRRGRPLTHQLVSDILAGFDIRVERAVITSASDDVFYARLILKNGGGDGSGRRIVEIDARPSDALVLATRAGSPIYATSAMLDSVEDVGGLLKQLREKRKEQGENGENGEAT